MSNELKLMILDCCGMIVSDKYNYCPHCGIKIDKNNCKNLDIEDSPLDEDFFNDIVWTCQFCGTGVDRYPGKCCPICGRERLRFDVENLPFYSKEVPENNIDEEKPTFKITQEDGKEIEYEILFVYDMNEEGDKVIVYTDNSFDEDGSLNVQASIRTVAEPQKLQAITDEKEVKKIRVILDNLLDETEDNE